WYYILAFFAQIIDGFAGFGSTTIAVPFLAIAIGTSSAVALLAVNSLVSGAIVFFTHIRSVNWKEYAKIALITIPLLPVGILAYSAISKYEAALKLILGAIVIYAGARGTWYGFVKKSEPPALGSVAQYAALIAGALAQGMFSVGGPFITLYANEQLKDKSSFRATMSAMWFSVNIVATTLRVLMLDMYTKETFTAFAYCLPVLASGVVIGMILHKRIDNAGFRKIVYLIMLAGGLTSTAYCLAGLIAA
ncbi:MAG TPA: sulfite exporter TauE/SafE family protein, partial [Clostridia bacterium]|nr:sulfite exporter TauE/SafE family protein [Clostridia bacterium]